jgi:uncharacterized protein (DUF2147 family)
MIRCLYIVSAFAWCCAALGQTASPAGLWQTVSDRTGQPDGLVRITEVDGEFVGTVAAVFSPPAKSAHPLCESCRGELKDKPVVGMAILRGVRRTPEGFSAGTILDPDDGRTYSCDLELLDAGRKLRLRGYLGLRIFGRSQEWTRKE